MSTQQLDHLGPHAGQADRQGVGAEEEHGPHHLVGQRIAGARGVRADEVALELLGVGRVDPHVGEVAEAGGDAVDGGALRDEALDDCSRGAHPHGRAGVELDGSPRSGDLDDLVDGEVPAGEQNRRHRSLYYAPCDGCRMS